MMSYTCTVSGPAVIDVHNKADFIEDRCSYTLLSDSWVSGVQILASFRERRRTDVSFVDSVTLRLEDPGVDVLLKQDDRVLVDNVALVLNSSVQEVHGVQLSKDQTGVTAKVTLSGRSAAVFFDGDTAQIHMEGPAGSSLVGLCGNSSSFSSAKLSEESSSSCESVYTEPADGTIDCPLMTKRCNLLKEAPFSSCNTTVDPAPYITACNATLCKYPAVDGLGCQFLWAYARACSLSNVALESWWSDHGGSSPPHLYSANDSQVTYKNTIMAQNSSSEGITRQDQFYIDFSCIHVQPEMKTVAFRIKDSSVVQHITSGEWSYNVTMKSYTDADRTHVVDSNTDVMLNQKIWVELETEGLDADLIAVVTDSCWATDQESPNSTPRYDLIQNRCANAADQTVMVEGNGEGTSNYFSFTMFQFIGSSGDVYLHCKLNLCIKEENSCVKLLYYYSNFP
ncbi:alpha-tectorin-like [Melanotaenia boesemani]|uniref:alpha-tectorin-like n=1 Tax=Melanotaenia boesemani TaxID=1250792 RepID=UPI001C0491D0|nr:alpha-tectorin-like [Melanotaenia boesemani]